MQLDQSTLDRLSQASDAGRKCDFLYLIDISDGNPNGDPDSDNRPRVDEDTGQGLITDVCLKRKVREYVDAVHGHERGNAIYVKNRCQFLEDVNADLLRECEADQEFLSWYADPYMGGDKGKARSLKPQVITRYACRRYYDWRCFGAVPGKAKGGANMEQSKVTGSIQIGFGRSLDPVCVQEHTISRIVQNKPSSTDQESAVHGTFGAKHTVRYGLYRFTGHYSPFLAAKTGFHSMDLRLFWEAMLCWPCVDMSAARPSMSVRGLYVFVHDHPFGNAPTHRLFERVGIRPAGDPKSFADYEGRISLPSDGDMPVGVRFISLAD